MRTRAYILERDGYECKLQYYGYLSVATEFDHYDHTRKHLGGNAGR